MSRISTPATISAAPEASQQLLKAVNKQIGSVPNLFRMVANSPAALEGYVALSDALEKSTVSAQTRERIAVAVAEFNGCDYCLSAHVYIGKNIFKLDDAEITANRSGHSGDSKADAAVRFAVKVVDNRGKVTQQDIDAVRSAGYTEAEIIEIVQLVALNTWTNYINIVADTEIDFPVTRTAQASADKK